MIVRIAPRPLSGDISVDGGASTAQSLSADLMKFTWDCLLCKSIPSVKVDHGPISYFVFVCQCEHCDISYEITDPIRNVN